MDRVNSTVAITDTGNRMLYLAPDESGHMAGAELVIDGGFSVV